MDTYINLDEWLYDKENKQIYNINTGEVIYNIDSVSSFIKDANIKNNADKDKLKQIKKEFGIQEYTDIYNVKWKKNSQFIKIYRTEFREYMKTIKLNSNEKNFIFSLQCYIEFKTNRIAKSNGDDFSNDELQELTGLSKNTLNKTLKTLETKLLIVRTGKGRARKIYFNPHLMCGGNDLLIETEKLFEEYQSITPY